jgi:hypothetical protein
MKDMNRIAKTTEEAMKGEPGHVDHEMDDGPRGPPCGGLEKER